MREIKKIVLLSIALLVCATTTQVVNAKDANPWAKAYIDIVYSSEATFIKGDYYMPNLSYDLIFFDEDDIPELVVSVDSYWVSMYSYRNGAVVTLMEKWAYGIGGNSGYCYIDKANLMVNQNADMAGGIIYTTFSKRVDGNIRDIYYIKRADMDYFGNIYPNTKFYKYDKNNKEIEISEKEYESLNIARDAQMIYGKYDMTGIVDKIQSFSDICVFNGISYRCGQKINTNDCKLVIQSDMYGTFGYLETNNGNVLGIIEFKNGIYDIKCDKEVTYGDEISVNNIEVSYALTDSNYGFHVVGKVTDSTYIRQAFNPDEVG